ncbi:CFDP2, partial [Symbiodinium necroappetens]
PAVVTTVDFPVWVVAVGHQPEALQLQINIPCDIEDAIDVVERSSLLSHIPFCDRVIPIRPQPFPACAAFVRAPDWVAYTAHSLICIDLRDMHPEGKGPVIAAFVTRPTCLAELCREAGFYGTEPADVYVGTDPIPIEAEESIALSSGCLVTFMRTHRCPFVANDLQYRLQYPEIWAIPAQFPKQWNQRSALLLLHSSGRYLLGSRPQNVALDVAAAGFVGVDRAEVNFHAPRHPSLQRFTYRAAEVRGVIAVVAQSAAEQIVVFLDMRQLGGGVRFLALPQPTIPLDALRRLVRAAPDATEADAMSGQLPVSFGSTPLPPVLTIGHSMNTVQRVASGVLEPFLADVSIRAFRDSKSAVNSRVVALSAFVCRLLVEPACTSEVGRQALTDLSLLTVELGGEWPYHPSDDAMPGIPGALSESSEAESDLAVRWATFAVFIPDYGAEQLTVAVQFPTTTRDVAPLVQQARDPQQVMRFPFLLPVIPQPVRGTGIYVGLPHWNPDANIVCLDLTAVDGRHYAAVAPTYADRDILCDLADLPSAADFHIYVGVGEEPLAGEGIYCVVQGFRHHRFIADLRDPMHYWQQLARAIGLDDVDCTWASACWGVELLGARREGQHLRVGSGYVLVAIVVRRPMLLGDLRPAAEAARDPHGPAADGGDFLLIPRPTVEDAVHTWQAQMTDSLALGAHPAVTAEADAVTQTLVAVPEYLSELYELPVPYPCDVGDVFQLLLAHRRAYDRRRFPGLHPVFPQPDTRFVVFIAVPAWHTAQTTVLIDARSLDGRLFAVNVPSRVNASSVFTIADCPADLSLQLYVRDVPWPLHTQDTVQVEHGDLLTIVPDVAPAPPRPILTDMLQTAEGRTQDDAFAGDYGDRVWLVTDLEPMLFEVNRRRREHFRTDVAAALGTTSERLCLRPAVPPVRDFADHGRLARSVLLALETPFPDEYELGPTTPFLLDLRPIQLGFMAAYAPAGGYDFAALARRLQAFASPGFSVTVWTTEPDQQLPLSVLHVRTGEVFRVEYLSLASTTAADTRWRSGSSDQQVTSGSIAHQRNDSRHSSSRALAKSVELQAQTAMHDGAARDTSDSRDEEDLLQDHHRHVTLLDEASSHSDYWAFTAVTLLEVLHEHAEEQARVALQHAAPAPISLAAALEVTPFQRSCMELQDILPHSVQGTDEQPDWLDADFSHLLSFPRLTLAQRTAFVNIHRWKDASPGATATGIDIFTDGPASGHKDRDDIRPAGWAFTVWFRTTGRSYFYGAASGTSSLRGTPYHIGETCDTPLQSELLAICWALIWALEYGECHQLPLHLHYDCQAAGSGTFGEARPASVIRGDDTPGLSQFAALLRQCVTQRMSLVSSYIPGHAGYIGNELSDGFAKYARTHPTPDEESLLPVWPGRLALHPLAEWAWMCIGCHADLPTPYAMEATAACMQAGCTSTRATPILGVSQPSVADTQVQFCLLCMSYNVLTLSDGPPGRTVEARGAGQEIGMRIKGKRHMIVDQCVDVGVHIIGLQETRLQERATLPDASYIMLHTAATHKGHFGCALWLSKVTPYAYQHGKPLYFEGHHCTVAAHSARHLLVHIVAPHFCCAVLVAHSPTAPMDNEGVVTAFWKMCSQDVRRLPNDAPLLVLADANCRVGSLASPAVGTHAAEVETPAGSAFHDFLSRHLLCLPATMDSCHSGPSWTWRSALGDRHRIDFVAVPQAWLPFEPQTCTWTAFETMQKRDDHDRAELQCFVGSSNSSLCLHGIVMLTHALPALYIGLRVYLRDEERELRRRYLLIGVASFILNSRGLVAADGARRRAHHCLRAIQISIARAWALLDVTCRTLRQAVRAERNLYLDRLVKDVGWIGSNGGGNIFPIRSPPVFDPHMLPSLSALEAAILGLKRAKAA